MLFTHDDDHLALHAQGVRHAGIAYCHRLRRSIGHIVDALFLVWKLCEPEEMAGRIEYL